MAIKLLLATLLTLIMNFPEVRALQNENSAVTTNCQYHQHPRRGARLHEPWERYYVKGYYRRGPDGRLRYVRGYWRRYPYYTIRGYPFGYRSRYFVPGCGGR